MYSLLPEDHSSKFISSSLLPVLCCVEAINSLPTHHHSADFLASGITMLIPCHLKIPLKKQVLWGMHIGSVATSLHMNRLSYCKTLIFGGFLILAILAVNEKSAKNMSLPISDFNKLTNV